MEAAQAANARAMRDQEAAAETLGDLVRSGVSSLQEGQAKIMARLQEVLDEQREAVCHL